MADVSGRDFRRDERAVSVTVNYVLSLVIASLLMTGLLVGVGDFAAGQRDTATRTELRVVGQQFAGDVASVDRLARGTDDGSVSVSLTYPERIVGHDYTIVVEADPDVPGGYVVTLTADDVTVRARFTAETDVSTPVRLKGGDVTVRYSSATDLLEVSND